MFKYAQIEKLLREGKSPAETAKIVPCGRSTADAVKRNLGIVNGTEQMVEHHTHYFEIHGYDKTVWMTRSEHFKLHQRLRNTGKCNVPIDDMKSIAMAAHQRTTKAKEKLAKYQSEPKYIEYVNSPEAIKHRRDYNHKNMWVEHHHMPMMPNITLKESIMYNMATNHITVSSGFYGVSKLKPLVINIA